MKRKNYFKEKDICNLLKKQKLYSSISSSKEKYIFYDSDIENDELE